MIVGIGVDLIEVERVEKVLEKHSGRFAARVYTEIEQAYCSGKARPSLHYAARFAAKEAFLKAIGTGLTQGVSWREIGVVHLPSGQPMLQLEGRALELMSARGGERALVSLSHSKGHACAVVLIEGVGNAPVAPDQAPL
ncbi:MAG: Holo-(acyl-carrier-protein) synthase [candidate division BRC1 bacterium ADurb.BinA364]|nr:MAG: Holo-(acyl-carrier-protein) synthase [candidate division BRC1 bacterium ADurb.BinA364]